MTCRFQRILGKTSPLYELSGNLLLNSNCFSPVYYTLYRLQASVASLKAENSQLQKKLAVILSRVGILEGEVDSEARPALEESFSLTSLNAESTAETRPKTTN